jgi:glycosyltransferase A (GT-A) superfamily protein (DUF2064 family)
MSRPDTGALQRARLEEAGLVVRDLATLRDIDTIADLEAVAPAVDAPWPWLSVAPGTAGKGLPR